MYTSERLQDWEQIWRLIEGTYVDYEIGDGSTIEKSRRAATQDAKNT